MPDGWTTFVAEDDVDGGNSAYAGNKQLSQWTLESRSSDLTEQDEKAQQGPMRTPMNAMNHAHGGGGTGGGGIQGLASFGEQPRDWNINLPGACMQALAMSMMFCCHVVRL